VNVVIESGEMGEMGEIACSDLTPSSTWRNASFREILEGGRAQARRNIPSPTAPITASVGGDQKRGQMRTCPPGL
jgi:hypothetical protein